MSSKDPDLDIDAEDIILLVEILKAAGYLEAKERDERAEKLALARFLTAAIQRGELTKAQLTAFLGKSGAPGGQNQIAAQTKTEAINRWEKKVAQSHVHLLSFLQVRFDAHPFIHRRCQCTYRPNSQFNILVPEILP